MQASDVYAILATIDGSGVTTASESVLRVSTKGLRKAAIGHVAFNTTQQAVPNILIVP